MTSMVSPTLKNRNTAFLIASAFFLTLLLIDLSYIYQFNNGHFIFTLDDPYIHLAMAENLWQGHYGVNLNEFSSPSSSILWPFIISPFVLTPFPEIFIILLNFGISVISLYFAEKILTQIDRQRELALSFKMHLFLLLLFVFAANLTGLIMLGMEHSLQVMLAIIIAWGLIETLQTNNAPRLLWFAIIIAPLIRYECLSVSGAALLWLFLTKNPKKSLLSGLTIVVLLGAFSFFLLTLNLSYLPESVISKSDVASTGLGKMYNHLISQFEPDRIIKSLPMFLLCGYLSIYAAMSRKNSVAKRQLALAGSLALFLHLTGGSIGWFFRYEIYVCVFALVILAYIQLTETNTSNHFSLRWLINILCVYYIYMSAMDGLVALIKTPRASNNIYLQQYQSHRFVTDYYKQPVAVNDLGWVSYKNDIYVLDLWGLASHEANQHRMKGDNIQWMNDLSSRHNVKLAMIYKSWFSTLPDNWVHVAEMDLFNHNTIASTVSFYAIDANSAGYIKDQLQAFSKTLPQNTTIRFIEN